MTKQAQETPAHSFEFRGAVIAARPLTIGDEASLNRLMERIDGEDDNVTQRYIFAEYQVGSQLISGEPPVPLVSADAPESEIAAAFAAFMQLPRAFTERWRTALEAAEGQVE